MQKFHHGQRVTCKIMGLVIKDAKISFSIDKTVDSREKRYFICQNYKQGNDAVNKLGYKYSWILDDDFEDPSVRFLKPAKDAISIFTD